MKQTFSREEVIAIIDDLLQHPDILMDAVQNEYTDWTAEELLEHIEDCLGFRNAFNSIENEK